MNEFYEIFKRKKKKNLPLDKGLISTCSTDLDSVSSGKPVISLENSSEVAFIFDWVDRKKCPD